MTYNPRYADLQPYPFERLRALTEDIQPPASLTHIPLSLGEPKHAPPEFVLEALADRIRVAAQLATYPATRGSDALRESIATWLERRFGTPIDAETEVIPVNGTREALFSLAQAMLSGKPDSLVMMPNPFYQIYEGAALLGGARPWFVNNDPAFGYHQDFDMVPADVWRRTELVFICSPGNPTGQVMPDTQMRRLIELAHTHDFIIASDECYSEIYSDHPPGSLLGASRAMGNDRYRRCLVLHSLSKRSNLPGLRSGFVAGDADLLADYLKYRTYHGCALGAHHQHVSTLAWSDEAHVEANRALYRRKFAAVEQILAPAYPIHSPAGGFYHWLPTPVDDLAFCRGMLADQHVTVMPGRFLARDSGAGNPGEGHVRVAWVAAYDDCVEAANRLAAFAGCA